MDGSRLILEWSFKVEADLDEQGFHWFAVVGRSIFAL